MTKLELLKAELELARLEVHELEEELAATPDGFVYFTCLYSFGSKSWDTHLNEFTVQDMCDEYFGGENGLVFVYTNNPNHTIKYAEVNILSLDELHSICKDNVTMSKAMTNLIAQYFAK